MSGFLLGVLYFWVSIAVFLIFPIYVAIQTYRKGHRTIAIVIYCSYIIPFFALATPVIAVIAFFKYKINKPNLDAEFRLQMMIGCGTSFCGATSRQDGGSFITTEWFRIMWIPLVPIQSYRVQYEGASSRFQGAVITDTKNYYIIEKLPLNIYHIIINYIFNFLAPILILAPIVVTGNVTMATVFLVASAICGFFLWRAK